VNRTEAVQGPKAGDVLSFGKTSALEKIFWDILDFFHPFHSHLACTVYVRDTIGESHFHCGVIAGDNNFIFYFQVSFASGILSKQGQIRQPISLQQIRQQIS